MRGGGEGCKILPQREKENLRGERRVVGILGTREDNKRGKTGEVAEKGGQQVPRSHRFLASNILFGKGTKTPLRKSEKIKRGSWD